MFFLCRSYHRTYFSNSLSIKKQVETVKNKYGEKRDLLLLDNNVLASDCFVKIISEIKELGFSQGAKFYYTNIKGKRTYKNRYVDFNQGVDARILTEEKVKLLSEIAIKPLRIAFDNINDEKYYVESVRLAAKYGIKTLSNYILFNHLDTPEDFYRRLEINIELNDKFEKQGYKTRVWSFPMKFTPIKGEEAIHRKHIGKNWNKKYLRGIQCILLATHGVVGPKRSFFEAAFGKNVKEFKQIIMLPEDFIIHRKIHKKNKDRYKLNRQIDLLGDNDKNALFEIVKKNDFKEISSLSYNEQIKSILRLYKLK